MELRLEDRWDDVWGNRYMIVEIVGKGRVDIKEKNDEGSNGFVYVMNCQNGLEVYKKHSIEGYTNLTEQEKQEVIEFAREQFEVEEEMDRRVYANG